MDLHEAMRTTFAAREYTGEPIDDATLYRILDHARFAPSGGNRQGWRVVVVREPRTRRALRDLAVAPARRYAAEVQRLLGLPSHVAVAAVLPLGTPRRQLTRLRRDPVESFATLERGNGPPLAVPDEST